MRSVFLGDIAVSMPWSQQIKASGRFLADADLVLANLEGAICSTQTQLDDKRVALCNSVDVLPILNAFHVRAVWLANNHMYDFPFPAYRTTQTLAEWGIDSFGAGHNLEAANRPFVFAAGNTTMKAFAFGWDVIGCKCASAKNEGVNPLASEHLLRTIRDLRTRDQHSLVIFIVHWNYEMERYPQPAHRQLAHDLIREGVDAIIGLHPHVAQGAELVNGKPVVYSLGNWFFPSQRLGRFYLSFPTITRRELALEVESNGREISDVRFHWHQYNPEYTLVAFEKTEGWCGEILNALTPFSGMTHPEYVEWFRHNRTRRKGLPVYEDYTDASGNRAKDRLVKARTEAMKMFVFLGLKRKLG